MARTIDADGVTYILADDGTAYRVTDAPAEPVASTPAEPVAASPFALAGVSMTKGGKPVTDNRPSVIRDAANAAPEGEAQEWARQAARVHRVPGFACSESVDVGGVSVAAHGYAWAAESGSKCKSAACKGRVL